MPRSHSGLFGPSIRPKGGDEPSSALTPPGLLEALRKMRSRHLLSKDVHLLAPV